jgi:hypothetical protein
VVKESNFNGTGCNMSEDSNLFFLIATWRIIGALISSSSLKKSSLRISPPEFSEPLEEIFENLLVIFDCK